MSTPKRLLLLPVLAVFLVSSLNCPSPPAGSITVSGHYKAGPILRAAPPTSNLFIVAHGHGSDSWKASSQLERDTTCWNTPLGCPYRVELQGLVKGEYIVAMELHDEEYQVSGGAKGVSTVLGYYSGPAAPADSLFNITDAARAGTLTIDEIVRSHTITLDIH